jgi:excisionase family DNA binding protein
VRQPWPRCQLPRRGRRGHRSGIEIAACLDKPEDGDEGLALSVLLVFLVLLCHYVDMKRSELIRTGTAAHILGTSRQHIVDLCNQGVLSCVRSPTQRRVRRTEVEALTAGMESPRPPNRDQRQSRWLNAAVAGRVVSDPAGTLEHARRNLQHLRTAHPRGMTTRWLDRWSSILESGPEAVLETLTSASPEAVELRQNSPFAGVLSDEERRAILTAFRAFDDRVAV